MTRIPRRREVILLYSLVMENPQQGTAEFLSKDQHTCEIRHVLDRVCNVLKGWSLKFVPRVETDSHGQRFKLFLVHSTSKM